MFGPERPSLITPEAILALLHDLAQDGLPDREGLMRRICEVAVVDLDVLHELVGGAAFEAR